MDESIIMSKLSKLNVNKSAGPDDIYPRILFEARAQLAYPLFILFDTSLRVKSYQLIGVRQILFLYIKREIKRIHLIIDL